MMCDYNEPWEGEIWHGCHATVIDRNGDSIAFDVPSIRHRDRIVACVNACAGFTTKQLEAAEGGVAALAEALGFYMRLPDFESCGCDRCVYARAALAPFTADAPEG